MRTDANVSGNEAHESTEGVPETSLVSIGFGMENARRYFMAQRLIDGADTPIGHRWSNLIEITQTIYGSTDPVQRERCIISFARNLSEILDLKRGLPLRQLSPPQLLLAYSTNTFH